MTEQNQRSILPLFSWGFHDQEMSRKNCAPQAAELVIAHRDNVLNNPPPPAEVIAAAQLLTEQEQEQAATKIQARHRGRNGRQRVAQMLAPAPAPAPAPLKYLKPSLVQRLAGAGNAEAIARANGVESLGRRIYVSDTDYSLEYST